MSFRIRIKFKPECRDDINIFFEKEMQRYKKSLKELKKPLGRYKKFLIDRTMSRYNLEPTETKAALDKMHEGYDFKAEFLSDSEAIMEWNNHFLIDYTDIAGELLAKVMFPMYFGPFAIAGIKGRDMFRAVRSEGFKGAVRNSIASPVQVSDRVRKQILEAETKRFKAIGAKVGED